MPLWYWTDSGGWMGVGWVRVMEDLSVFAEFPFQRTSDTELLSFHCSGPKHTIEFPMIRYTCMPMWRYCEEKLHMQFQRYNHVSSHERVYLLSSFPMLLHCINHVVAMCHSQGHGNICPWQYLCKYAPGLSRLSKRLSMYYVIKSMRDNVTRRLSHKIHFSRM